LSPNDLLRDICGTWGWCSRNGCCSWCPDIPPADAPQGSRVRHPPGPFIFQGSNRSKVCPGRLGIGREHWARGESTHPESALGVRDRAPWAAFYKCGGKRLFQIRLLATRLVSTSPSPGVQHRRNPEHLNLPKLFLVQVMVRSAPLNFLPELHGMFGGLTEIGRIDWMRSRGTKNFMSRSEPKRLKLV
jgi:hypothetical protein